MLNFIDSVNSLDNQIKLYGQSNNSEYSTSPIDEPERGLNGEIDEPIYQGDYEDCWLIAGILAMSYTEAGAEILRDSIHILNDGSVEISFDGIGETYNISEEEMAMYNYDAKSLESDYSTGDDDMLALELAFQKMIEEYNITKYSIEDGGNPYYVFKLYGAENLTFTKTKEDVEDSFKHFEENPVCGLKTGHGYTIKSIDGDNVVLIDPWDTTEEIIVSKEKLLDNSNNISIVYGDFE